MFNTRWQERGDTGTWNRSGTQRTNSKLFYYYEVQYVAIFNIKIAILQYIKCKQSKLIRTQVSEWIKTNYILCIESHIKYENTGKLKENGRRHVNTSLRKLVQLCKIKQTLRQECYQRKRNIQFAKGIFVLYFYDFIIALF